MNNFLKLLILFILFVLISINIVPDKGTFNDIILERYPNKEFNKFNIAKVIDDPTKSYFSDESQITEEFLTYFQNLNVEVIDKLSMEVHSKKIYEIDFSETNTYSSILIIVLNEEYLYILNSIFIRKYDKEQNEISYDKINDSDYIKIVDGKLDLDYIEEIYKSLKEREVGL